MGPGTWTAEDGKTVTIEHDDGLRVTVSPAPGAPPYQSAELLGGGTKAIHRLPASTNTDGEGREYLEIEAGTPNLGPTYRLHPEGDTLWPVVVMGLYDDYDDDLGAPWAFPLLPLHRS
ncbi:hypothetical protein [Allokutzneria oryzae]|uniref:Uncharacterized protein n=1 Tax=Allokutzneria oryzae TaxID=1378989 RepID=A0ABV5ZXS9_9PSEU